MESSNKVAVVTGAGSGIGRAVSLSLIGAGYRVALAGRRRESLEETAGLATGVPGRSLVVPRDVGQPEDVERVFSETIAGFGRLASISSKEAGTSNGQYAWYPLPE